MRYNSICAPLADYLLKNQVSIPDTRIRIKDGSGAVSVKFLKRSARFRFRILLKKDGLYVINKYEDICGPYKEGELFRLNPYPIKQVSSDYGFSKAKLIKRLAFTLCSLTKHLLENFMDYGSRMLVKDFIRKLRKEPLDTSRGGLLFTYRKCSDSEIMLSCYDNGGIFDTRINGEGKELTPRVMGAYYADAYSAYCFARRYAETKNRKYLDGAVKALEFIKRTYENYPKSIVWYHHDFKNPAYVEALLLLKGVISSSKYTELYALIPLMREDFYEPTNVYALRFHWRMARQSLGFWERRHINACLRRLKKDQTNGGLIHDNNLEDYNDAHDITYHQYSLACLAAGLEYSDDAKAREIFRKGCEFSYSILSQDGEISYNGRGSNNIYHLASAIYAFERAANMFKAPKFSDAAAKMLKYLAKWQKKEGYFPTAMNKYVKERMAWNHCHTPYNALTCYLLYKADDAAKKVPKHNTLKPREGLEVMDEEGYASFSNKNYCFTFFSGCAQSYPWSDGCHKAGYAGTALLSINGLGATNLILDKDLKNNLLATDLPVLKVNGRAIEFSGRGRLIATSKNSFEYKKTIGDISLLRRYRLNGNSIIIETKLRTTKKCIISSPGLISIPLVTENGWELSMGKEALIQRKGNMKVRYNCPLKLACIKSVMSNPRGKGRIFYFGSIEDANIDGNIDYAYALYIS